MSEPTIGYTLTCPHCGSNNTYYSALHQAWQCQDEDCGELFSLSDVEEETAMATKSGLDKIYGEEED